MQAVPVMDSQYLGSVRALETINSQFSHWVYKCMPVDGTVYIE